MSIPVIPAYALVNLGEELSQMTLKCSYSIQTVSCQINKNTDLYNESDLYNGKRKKFITQVEIILESFIIKETEYKYKVSLLCFDFKKDLVEILNQYCFYTIYKYIANLKQKIELFSSDYESIQKINQEIKLIEKQTDITDDIKIAQINKKKAEINEYLEDILPEIEKKFQIELDAKFVPLSQSIYEKIQPIVCTNEDSYIYHCPIYDDSDIHTEYMFALSIHIRNSDKSVAKVDKDFSIWRDLNFVELIRSMFKCESEDSTEKEIYNIICDYGINKAQAYFINKNFEYRRFLPIKERIMKTILCVNLPYKNLVMLNPKEIEIEESYFYIKCE